MGQKEGRLKGEGGREQERKGGKAGKEGLMMTKKTLKICKLKCRLAFLVPLA